MFGFLIAFKKEIGILYRSIIATNLSHKTASFINHACPGKLYVLEEYDAKT